MKQHSIATLVPFVILFILAAPLQAQEKLSPREALQKAHTLAVQKTGEYIKEHKDSAEPREYYASIKASIIKDLLPTVQAEGLSPQEQLSLAYLYSNARMYDSAFSLYRKLAVEKGKQAGQASAFHIMLLLDLKKYAEAETLIGEHQKRFPYTAEEDARYFVGVLSRYAQHLAREEKHQEVVALITSELDRLPDSPQTAFSAPELIGEFIDIYDALGQRDKALALMGEYLTDYKEVIKERASKLPDGQSEEAEQARANLKTANRIVKSLESKLTCLKIIGEQAPSIGFNRVFNAPDDFSFTDLKGKVVLIDFWANWCGPCKAAFPTLRKIYDEYRDKGFVVLGVTGLQGRFIDGDINIQSAGPEEEYKLTEEFIKRHEMNWPVVFGERGPFDPKYGVSGIPTMVILDKKGVVREFKVGFREEEANKLRETIMSLLEEQHAQNRLILSNSR